MSLIEILIERIVPEGKGVGNFDGKQIYVLGAFPGEKVKVEIYKSKKDFAEAKLIEVLNPIPQRIEPKEKHFMSCSPWQSINYDYQIELKKEILKKCFRSLSATEIELENFYKSPKIFNYRNKLEFSFDEEIEKQIDQDQNIDQTKKTFDEPRKLFLAFHERGSHRQMVRLHTGCILGQEEMNKIALQILDLLNQSEIQEFDLKSLVIRQSISTGKVIALLLVKNEKERIQKLIINSQSYNLDNFTIALSDYRSPMAKIDKILFQNGEDFLVEEISGLKFKYYLDSFFQNNIDLFEESLKIMKKFLIKDSNVLELYSGVGSIGMNLAKDVKEITGVEIVESATKAAEENYRINELSNYRILLLPAEKIDKSILDEINVLIVDPPRTGLHQKIIQMILEKTPKQIIYLSCNPITQASDFNKLKEVYNIKHISGYDFYPNTPHLESLIVLELNK